MNAHGRDTRSQRYAKHGYRRRWIANRLAAIDTRQELAREWHQRGAVETDHFRQLTNALFHAAFGMEVEQFRAYKGSSKQNLRDHLTDLELALLGLAETTAIELSRSRGSSTFFALLADVADAGAIIANTRRKIDAARLRSAV